MTLVEILLHFFAFGFWGDPFYHFGIFLRVLANFSMFILFSDWMNLSSLENEDAKKKE
ncbi:MAG TPA: hypothetical protein P5056_03740 [Candidatus Paceibacterota bacterium]|nr:hypothetical protein [Candidatus Paceibacterota bacterium]